MCNSRTYNRELSTRNYINTFAKQIKNMLQVLQSVLFIWIQCFTKENYLLLLLIPLMPIINIREICNGPILNSILPTTFLNYFVRNQSIVCAVIVHSHDTFIMTILNHHIK